MKKLVAATTVILSLVTLAHSQTTETTKDSCHVYVVDVAKGRKAWEERPKQSTAEQDKAISEAKTEFPEFYPLIGEEELTTKTYRFPRTRLVITASVFYTDESMASAEGVDSMLIGIVVSPRAQREAISAENNAVAEVTMNAHRDTVRAQRYVRVTSRLFLVGIECRSKERPEAN